MIKRAASLEVMPKNKLFRTHPSHNRHLCTLVRHRRMNKAADLAAKPKFFCFVCGRAAAKAENLCEPVEL